jgi:hypothetical protein
MAGPISGSFTNSDLPPPLFFKSVHKGFSYEIELFISNPAGLVHDLNIGISVAVGLGVSVGVRVGVKVDVEVGNGVNVAVAVGVGKSIAVGDGVAVGAANSVAVGVDVQAVKSTRANKIRKRLRFIIWSPRQIFAADWKSASTKSENRLQADCTPAQSDGTGLAPAIAV